VLPSDSVFGYAAITDFTCDGEHLDNISHAPVFFKVERWEHDRLIDFVLGMTDKGGLECKGQPFPGGFDGNLLATSSELSTHVTQ
jgi:hypothetical protein